MESSRCIELVKSELHKLGLLYKNVELGEVELKGSISDEYISKLDLALKECGLEIIYNKEKLIIEKIKDTINKFIYRSEDFQKYSLTDFLRKRINFNYTYLSNLFSKKEGITIEKYFIEKKIEYVKELLVFEKLSLSDISFKLNYSSVAHLCNQFKKVTGLTPSFFRQLRNFRHSKVKKCESCKSSKELCNCKP